MTLALTTTPVRLARLYPSLQTIHLRVLAGAVRIGPEQSSLEVGSGGISVLPADGIQHFEWRNDEVWIMAEATATVEFVIA